MDTISKEQAISGFKAMLANSIDSKNQFNQINLRAINCIDIGVCRFEELYQKGFKLAPNRGMGDSYTIIQNFIAIIASSGFNADNPIILDRDYNLLDGYQRLHACRILKEPFTFIVLNCHYQDFLKEHEAHRLENPCSNAVQIVAY